MITGQEADELLSIMPELDDEDARQATVMLDEYLAAQPEPDPVKDYHAAFADPDGWVEQMDGDAKSAFELSRSGVLDPSGFTRQALMASYLATTYDKDPREIALNFDQYRDDAAASKFERLGGVSNEDFFSLVKGDLDKQMGHRETMSEAARSAGQRVIENEGEDWKVGITEEMQKLQLQTGYEGDDLSKYRAQYRQSHAVFSKAVESIRPQMTAVAKMLEQYAEADKMPELDTKALLGDPFDPESGALESQVRRNRQTQQELSKQIYDIIDSVPADMEDTAMVMIAAKVKSVADEQSWGAGFADAFGDIIARSAEGAKEMVNDTRLYSLNQLLAQGEDLYVPKDIDADPTSAAFASEVRTGRLKPGMRPLTLDERYDLPEAIESEKRRDRMAGKLYDLMQSADDPFLALDDSPFLKGASEVAAQSAGYAGALIVGGSPAFAASVASFANDERRRLLEEDPDLDWGDVQTHSWAVGTVTAGIERLQAMIPMGKLPLTKSWAAKMTNAGAGKFLPQLTMRTLATGGFEFGEELAQEMTPWLVTELERTMGKDLPEVDLREQLGAFANMAPEMVIGMLPMILMGAGPASLWDVNFVKNFKPTLDNPDMMRLAGLSEADINDIQKIEDPNEQVAAFQEKWADRDTTVAEKSAEALNKLRTRAQRQAQHQQESDIRPTVEKVDGGYQVRYPGGQVIAAETAEDADALAKGETYNKESLVDVMGLSEEEAETVMVVVDAMQALTGEDMFVPGGTPGSARLNQEGGWVKGYHGSPDFIGDEFDRKYLGRNVGISRGGFSFAPDRESAEAYMQGGSDPLQSSVDAVNEVLDELSELDPGEKWEMPDGTTWSELDFRASNIDDLGEFQDYVREIAAALKDSHPALAKKMEAAADYNPDTYKATPRLIEAWIRNPEEVDVHGRTALVVKDPNDIRIIAPQGPVSPQMDAEYLAAVEAGDEARVQEMVNSAMLAKGYSTEIDKGDHEAPNKEDTPVTALDSIFPDDIYEGTAVRYYGHSIAEDGEAVRKLQRWRGKPNRVVTVFRAVPKDIKGDDPRTGDWVSTTRGYAQDHGRAQFGAGNYRIMSIHTKAKNLWSDGNSIHELGFDDGGTYAYANTKNNRKSADPITRDESGNVIPLSQRFNPKNPSTLYQQQQPITTDDPMSQLAEVTVAPVRRDNLKNFTNQEKKKRASSTKFAHLDRVVSDTLAAFGVKAVDRVPVVGGWLEQGKKKEDDKLSLEVPQRVTLQTDWETAEMLAGLIAAQAPQLQNSAMVWQQKRVTDPGVDAIKATIKTKGAAKGKALAEAWMKMHPGAGFTFHPDTGIFETALQGTIEELNEQLEEFDKFVEASKAEGHVAKNQKTTSLYGTLDFHGEGRYREDVEKARAYGNRRSGAERTRILDIAARAEKRLDAYDKALVTQKKAAAILPTLTKSKLSLSTILDEIKAQKLSWKGKGRGTGIRYFADWIDARFKRLNKVGHLDITKPATIKKATDALVYDIIQLLSEDGSGSGWYDHTLHFAFEELRRIHPELDENNPKDTAAFITALAATSQGYTVVSNFEAAEAVYARFKKDGVFPTDLKFAKASEPINMNLAEANDLIAKHSFDWYVEFMDKEFSARILGETVGRKIPDVKLDDIVRGNTIMGQKIGSFFNNMRGRFDTVTMDLWFTRTMGRYTGETKFPITSDKVQKQIADFKRLLKGKSRSVQGLGYPDNRSWGVELAEDATDEEVVDAGIRIFNQWGKASGNAYSDKPYTQFADGAKLEHKARDLHTTAVMKGAPQSPVPRQAFKKVVVDATARLNKMGIEMTPADAQAIVWFGEKLLFAEAGVASDAAAPADYLDAAMVLREKLEEGSGIWREKAGLPAKVSQDQGGLEQLEKAAAPSPLFQESPDTAKASVEFMEDGVAIVRSLKGSDVTSVLHEVAHIARRRLFVRGVEDAKRGGMTEADVKIIEKWCGVEEDGVWEPENEEVFSRGVERFVTLGKIPSEGLRVAFTKLNKWFRGIYGAIEGSDIDVEISPEVEAVLSKWLSRGEMVSSLAHKIAKDNAIPVEEVQAVLNDEQVTKAPRVKQLIAQEVGDRLKKQRATLTAKAAEARANQRATTRERAEKRDAKTKEAKAATQQAKADARERLREAQENVREMERLILMLPIELRGKIKGFSAISKLTNPDKIAEKIDKALTKADAVLEAWQKGKNQTRLEKLIKSVDSVKKNGTEINTKISPNAQKNLRRILGIMATDTATKTLEVQRREAQLESLEQSDSERQLIEEYLEYATFADWENQTAGEQLIALEELDAIISGAKEAKKINAEEERARVDALRIEFQNAVSGGAGILEDSAEDIRTKEYKRGFKKIFRDAQSYWRKNLSFEWLLNSITRHDATKTRSLNSPIIETIYRPIHEASNFAEQRIFHRMKWFRERLMDVFADTPTPGVAKGLHSKGSRLAAVMEKWDDEVPSGIYVREGQGKTITDTLTQSDVDKIVTNPAAFGYSAADVERLQQVASVEEGRFKFKRREKEGELKERTISQMEALNYYMLWEQDRYKPVMEYWGWEPESIQQLEEFLTPEAWKIREILREYYDESWGDMNPTYEAVFGMPMPDSPMYAPGGFEHEQQERVENLMDGPQKLSARFPGVVKGRILHRAKPLKRSALDVFSGHLHQTTHFIAYAEAVKALRQIMSTKDAQKVITQNYGKDVNRVVQQKIEQFVDGGSTGNAFPIIDTLRSAFTVSKLAYKPWIMMKQWTSFPAYGFNVPLNAMMKYHKEFVMHPKKALAVMRSLALPEVRWGRGYERDVIRVMGSNQVAPSRLHRVFRFGMITGRTGDITPIVISGYSAYRHGYEEAKKAQPDAGHDAWHREGEYLFERATQSSQQAGEIKDLSWYASQGSFARLFTMFKTSVRQYMNNTYDPIIDAIAAHGDGRMTRDMFDDAMKRFLIGHVVLPVLFQAVSDVGRWGFGGMLNAIMGTDDENEEYFTKDSYIRAMTMGTTNGAFMAGDWIETFLTALVSGKVYGDGLNIDDTKRMVAQSLQRLNSNWLKDLTEDQVADMIFKTMDDLAQGASNITGFPYDAVKNAKKFGLDVQTAWDHADDNISGAEMMSIMERELEAAMEAEGADPPTDEEKASLYKSMLKRAGIVEPEMPLTKAEKKLKSMGGVSNGAKARAIVDIMNNKNNPQEWLDQMIKAEVVSKSVLHQVYRLRQK